jgi:hypothetical protein
MSENWVIIKGWPNYAVSDLGRIKSLRRKGSHNIIEIEKMLKPNLNDKGYFNVKLYNSSGKQTIYIHTLVGLHFLVKEEWQTEIHHIDGNTQNNLPSNLKWVSKFEHLKITRSETLFGHGCKGEDHGCAKLNKTDIVRIRELYFVGGLRNVDLARKYNITKTHVGRILQNKS